MLLPTILLLILLSFMRKSLRKNIDHAEWAKIATGGIILSVGLILLHSSVRPSQPWVAWFSYGLITVLVYYIFTRPPLFSLKPLFLALSPMLAVNFLESLTKLISYSFYKEWDDYFNIAELLAMIWMIAMLVSNNKQRKALEAERLKNEAKEKEYRITEQLKAQLEVQVNERTAELTLQKEELQQALDELTATQAQLVHSEKMASLGELTAGIAHEIQNPLNFVNNFSEVSNELIAEMKEEIARGNFEEANAIAADVQQNLEKINHHGKRADAIVKGMLQHSRKSNGLKEPTDINVLADEYVRLCYHGLRAKDKSFNATIKTDFGDDIGTINIVSQDIGRVIMNLLTNAFYAVNARRAKQEEGYKPTVSVITRKADNEVLIKVSDNGMGIPAEVIDKIFQPFFTTKPTGQGTGLGLSLSYDIVTKGHGGDLEVETSEGAGTSFTIRLPIIN
ncbi:MAG: GHKL domain-containing protein [Chitinophagaceae bacterium]|nr:MAG: GHKL domain-containing protein [Chitinophagaceae bacterium]